MYYISVINSNCLDRLLCPRIVTALKTLPPMEFYEFSPSKSFADFDALFEGAGSENREQLLPGELEFSDQVN